MVGGVLGIFCNIFVDVSMFYLVIVVVVCMGNVLLIVRYAFNFNLIGIGDIV